LKQKNKELTHAKHDLDSKIESLEKEVSSLKKEKEEMNKRIDDLSKFKSNDTSLKLEIASLQSTISHKDQQVQELKNNLEESLKQKDSLTQEITSLKLEKNDLDYANKSLQDEKTKLIAKQELNAERSTTLSNELSKMQIQKQTVATELEKLKTKYDLAVKEKSHLSGDAESFKQQYDELTMKAKEAAIRIDNLEDELNESRTMLQERTRETTTIKRLLLDAEEQIKSKTALLKQETKRLNEERSGIESENQIQLRRKQRDIDEIKSLNESYLGKINDLEKTLRNIKEEYDLAKSNEIKDDNGEKDDQMQKTIETLRQSLQASTKRVKDYENLNNVLKKLNEESTLKFERLSKNYKILTQQYKLMKTTSSPSERVSSESSSSELADNSSKDQNPTNIAYLKNVLLGFFEHKEQREQLLPVVKTLFSFSSEDERKFLLALK
jgi:predicted RNase H-like nuclease (RuvC/YqgF family)